MARAKAQAPKGTQDVPPPVPARWERLLAAYAPTGDYEVGRLANPGKNYWTFEPTLALMYFGQKNGFEASLFTGMSFNLENEETDYTSGNLFHVDGTLAQIYALAAAGMPLAALPKGKYPLGSDPGSTGKPQFMEVSITGPRGGACSGLWCWPPGRRRTRVPGS